MLNTVLPKLEQLVESLIEKNQTLSQELNQAKSEKAELEQKIATLIDENETIQLEMLEQEEKHNDSINQINQLLSRLEQATA
ncbi:hypothetical protein [Catenovulum maritimum]|uniref:DUF904 domain-containing protein n=1 Tax=Catenovulum maritimum TaxID=1513271 RepID=A0A0J8GMG2_9ALTE|nr:hypothetical protein [Catenovulum maritimum]KMT63975.1 hypothetical protein XM47_16830 [Catenovulum maritimum]